MGFFGEAKHKVEEVVGRIEETLGGAFGNSAMQASGHAHAEHGEALVEEDEAREKQHSDAPEHQAATGPGTTAPATGPGTAAAQEDDAARQHREQEQRMDDVDRRIDEAKRAQDAVADSGEQLRHAGSTGAAPTEPGA
ncbi:hypothetical protein [Cumulibacter manganitolerans]|uniref:hypothetical protein n=1 Tax=Cumulibacter manganitolerans TaxID=1884992 RepID=UPI0012978CC4|nr:hypothetical protein [Cumulibacter manganitolerans]